MVLAAVVRGDEPAKRSISSARHTRTIRSSKPRCRSCAAGRPAVLATGSQRVGCSPSTASVRWKMPACRNCASALVFPARLPICAMMRNSLKPSKNISGATICSDRRSGCSHGQKAQSHERQPHRYYHRQHGTLALVPPRHPQIACGGQRADFTLKVIHDGRQVWTSRVVIGKPSMPSPLLAQQMDSITINPTWKVPASIVRNEYLPAQARDPGALARMGMRVNASTARWRSRCRRAAKIRSGTSGSISSIV